MIITYKTVNKIQFPVFPISSTNWDSADGLLFLDGVLLDDKNMPGETLGQRRLQTPFQDLVPLKHAITTHLGLIKQNKHAFIDKLGVPFIYEKTLFCKLKYYKIRKIERKEIASILWAYDINIPFIIPRPPKPEHLWVGILHLKGHPWLLYEYAEERLKDTRRKV